MPKISLDEALKKLESGKYDPVYFLIGKEKFFHDLFIQLIIKKLFPDKSSRDLNLIILYGSENTLSEMISTALSYPMLSKNKLVLARDFDKMKLSDADALSKYLHRPQKSTCLVLSAEESGRSKIFNELTDKALTIECKPIPEYKIGDWIVQRCKQRGFSIEGQAIQFLISQVGASLLSIEQELDKISNFKTTATTITIEDLEQTTGISRDESVFALQKALAHRKLEHSLRIAQRLLEAGHDSNEINAILFAHFRKALIASSLKQRGQNPKQIAESMKLPDFQLRDITETLSFFNYQQIKLIISLLHQMDIEAKTSTKSDKAGLQMLCYKICRT